MRTPILLVLLLFCPSVLAGVGAAELALDRGSVAALIAMATPEPRQLTLPGVGTVTLAIRPPSNVRFVEGGIETAIKLVVKEIGHEEPIELRLEPRVREEDGVVELVATRVQAEGLLAMVPDLAAMIRPVELPRNFESAFQPKGAGLTQLYISVQRVRVSDERLVLELGMATKKAPSGAAK